jgi:AbrB family looped-hinge helix DNA binding protein
MKNIRQINDRNQITLPPYILKSVGLKQGDFIEVEARETELILKPKSIDDVLTESDWNTLDKLVKKQIKAKEFKEYHSIAKAKLHLKRIKK